MEGGAPNGVTRNKWQTQKTLVQELGDLDANPNSIKNILKNTVSYKDRKRERERAHLKNIYYYQPVFHLTDKNQFLE